MASAGVQDRRVLLAAVAILTIHYALAASSLVREGPTVDEVVHLPAGVSYWQTGQFKLYHHNPPLVKLIAAIPVVLSDPLTEPIYGRWPGWRGDYPSQSDFAAWFLSLNTDRYFEMFTRARLLMPFFSVLAGAAVFLWSRRLHGPAGGLLSLTLWCLCPNVLAHARLVTTDIGATAFGVTATYAFWRFLNVPSWKTATASGVLLGLAQLTKFSSLLLLGTWPVLWLAKELEHRGGSRLIRLARGAGWGVWILAFCVLTIDLGYGFEGVGTPIGRLPFAGRSFLTRPGREPRLDLPGGPSRNPLIDIGWAHRVNRFRGTILESVPSPLPREYLLGFDDQKIEADGVPIAWFVDDWFDPRHWAPLSEVTTYPVYLDGVLRRHGWWYYYLITLVYKVPEGTWALVGLGAGLSIFTRRPGVSRGDMAAVWLVPSAILAAISLLTDINIGLRYVLVAFPYLFIGAGRVAPWAAGLGNRVRPVAVGLIGAMLIATAAATASIHPSYLAYFNWASGGPTRGSEHLIDSNLDWGQDLVGLREYLRREQVDEPIGLAYFGQVPPAIFEARGDGFPWFLPPPTPGRSSLMGPTGDLVPTRLRPGLYAVSASLLRGLPWRVYGSTFNPASPNWFRPTLNLREHAYAYFRDLEPLSESIGHSILLYRITPAQAAAINAREFDRPQAAAPLRGPVGRFTTAVPPGGLASSAPGQSRRVNAVRPPTRSGRRSDR